MLFYLDRAIRTVALFFAYPISWLLVPFKLQVAKLLLDTMSEQNDLRRFRLFALEF